VLVSPDGLVLTVFSLLIDSEHIRAVTNDGSTYEADVIFRDADRQLAVLQLKARPLVAAPGSESVASLAKTFDPFPFFNLPCAASSAGEAPSSPCPELQVGDWVVAAGNPFKVADGAEPVSIAHGIFSARTRLDARRKVKDFPYHGDVLVIDAITSNPGAPGSALVDIEGCFVGMIGRVVVSNRTHTHFNYAIPRDLLAEFLRLQSCGGIGLPVRDAAEVEPAPIIDVGLRSRHKGFLVLLNGPFARRELDDLILSSTMPTWPTCEFGDLWRTLSGRTDRLVIRRDRRIISVRLEPATP
jgi:serine protease Do